MKVRATTGTSVSLSMGPPIHPGGDVELGQDLPKHFIEEIADAKRRGLLDVIPDQVPAPIPTPEKKKAK